MLADLRQRVERGGCWWSAVPAVGEAKALRIAEVLRLLPPKTTTPAPALQAQLQQLACVLTPAAGAGAAAIRRHALDGSRGNNRVGALSAATTANNDWQALQAWIEAKAGRADDPSLSAATAKAYHIEGERLLLWCVLERRKALSSMTAEDCGAYMAFLAELPAAWISRRRAARWQPGWTPFAGPLSLRSRQHVLHIVHGLFKWLVQAGYLASESSFARVLRAHGQSRHRGRAKAPRATRPPTTHAATAPGQVWCWDMTYLSAEADGSMATTAVCWPNVPAWAIPCPSTWRCTASSIAIGPRWPRQTFAEQVQELALPRQRCTSRLAAARRSIALALGGKAGSRRAELLGGHAYQR